MFCLLTTLVTILFSDIRLDWQTFNQDDSPRQLLDFVVSYGEEFPLRNPDGTEIIPEDEDEEEDGKDTFFLANITYHSLALASITL